MEERLDAVTLRLIEKIEQAINELDSYVTTTHTKEKTLEYDDEGKKTTGERIVETEEISIVKGLIDRSALKQLAATVKELRSKAEHEEDNDVTVILSEEIKELAE